ncbi:MAG: entericidin [Rickettsiales bacterium]|nr:entericidin [Rickettsiales bacterium]
MKKLLLLNLSLLLLLSACNTMEGLGRDMRGAGDGIANSASKVKEKL